MSEVLDQRNRDRTADVNMVQNANCATSDNRNRKASPRQGSPAPSRQEVFLAERRRQLAQFVSRTRLSPGQVTKVTQHQEEVVGNETSLRKVMVISNGHGQVSVRKDKDPLHLDPRHPVKVALDLCRHRRRQCAAGQGAPRLRPPAPPNTGNWRPGWRSPTGDGSRLPPAQPQSSPAPRRWVQNFGCHVCRQFGCHSHFHGPDAVSLQAPPGLRCFV